MFRVRLTKVEKEHRLAWQVPSLARLVNRQ